MTWVLHTISLIVKLTGQFFLNVKNRYFLIFPPMFSIFGHFLFSFLDFFNTCIFIFFNFFDYICYYCYLLFVFHQITKANSLYMNLCGKKFNSYYDLILIRIWKKSCLLLLPLFKSL